MLELAKGGLDGDKAGIPHYHHVTHADTKGPLGCQVEQSHSSLVLHSVSQLRDRQQSVMLSDSLRGGVRMASRHTAAVCGASMTKCTASSQW